MSFLQEIHALSKARAETSKKNMPEEKLRDMPLFSRTPRKVKDIFKSDRWNIIAEIKFSSPSQGILRASATPEEIAEGYLDAGAAMISALTEPVYFKGDLNYLKILREKFPEALLLRKDFIADAYQLLEARAYGADAALLIIGMTGRKKTEEMLHAAHELHLTPLVEVHDATELEQAIEIGADFIGINNRDLKTLKIDLNTGRNLAKMKPKDAIFICESGLSTVEDLRDMRTCGYDGFLIGTHFMRHDNPGDALKALMEELACA